MSSLSPVAKKRLDYQPADFIIETVDLNFELDDHCSRITATSQVRRNGSHQRPLALDGAGLKLIAVAVDGQPLAEGDYQLSDSQLIIPAVPAQFELSVVTETDPASNTLLEGLYKSGGAFCTQCEAEGFRRITYFTDRPDVMAVYTTRIEADKTRYPSLLANGNKIAAGELENNRHWAQWHDPHPKPSYLFALVAGDFDCLRDSFVTASGRNVALELYVDKGNLSQAGFAMASLIEAMRWDEQRYGREYDLDIYMIVAVDFFNMGAMENKGLNIFNSKYVLADPKSATDDNYHSIQAIIAHEYFHNWTGNRITCRDWFQLSLKEGLTVFRDQQFSADMGSPVVNRIQQVRTIRDQQFAEDSSPMAHPIRPDQVIEMNNFYTVTVYNKGAEVIRMLHTLLGEQGYARGMACYFERFDGQAVTCEDFICAMEQGSDQDLAQFRRWYSQSGTPELTVRDEYDSSQQRYTLNVSQHTPPTQEQPEKLPLLIPLSIGLYNSEGQLLPSSEQVLQITQAEQSFTFEQIPERPVPALLQEFSAPVRLDYPYSEQQLIHLLAHAQSDFVRWDAAQTLYQQLIQQQLAADSREPLTLSEPLVKALSRVVEDDSLDPALVAEILTIPEMTALGELFGQVDVDGIHQAWLSLRQALAGALHQPLWQRITGREGLSAVTESDAADSAAKRRLYNTCLLLAGAGAETGPDTDLDTKKETGTAAGQTIAEVTELAYQQAENMTLSLGALRAAVVNQLTVSESLLAQFEQQWQLDSQVIDKWFAQQASRYDAGALARIRQLTEHPAFDWQNPNRVRALIGTFAFSNPVLLHAADGSGYRYIADCVIRLNSINPQVAARLIGSLSRFTRYDASRQSQMQLQLQRVVDTPELAKDIYEIASRALASAVAGTGS